MAPQILVLSNPSKRKGARRHSAKRKHAFRFKARSNPLPLVGGVMPTLKLAGVGTLGALANDLVFGFVRPKLPAVLQSDAAVGGLKVLGALAIGAAANLVKRGSGRNLAIGAATCALHDAARNLVIAKFPNALGEYMSMGSIGEYLFQPNAVGEYVGDYASNAIPVSGFGDPVGVGGGGDGYSD